MELIACSLSVVALQHKARFPELDCSSRPGLGRPASAVVDNAAMLHLNDITLRVAGRPLLEGATLHVPAGQRFGLVGRNGTGKSTLLRLIAGELQPDVGSVRLQAGTRIGMVAQEAPGGELTPPETVLAADR